jgi:hypothetical protein
MGKGNSSAVAILIVGALAVLLLFSGTIIAFIGGLPGQIQGFIERIRGGLPGTGSNVSGYTWIGYTVTFADGTTQDIRQSRPSLSLFPFSISFDGKNLTQIRLDIKAEVDEGDITAWNTSTSLRVELYKKTEGTPKTSSTGNYTQSGSTWVSNTVKTICSFTVGITTLESVIRTYGDGAYLLQAQGTVSLTVTSGGSTFTLDTVTPAGGVDITYSNGSPSGLSIFGGVSSLTG